MSWEDILKEKEWPKKVAFADHDFLEGGRQSRRRPNLITILVEHKGDGVYEAYQFNKGYMPTENAGENEIPISEIPEDIRNEKWSFHYGQMMSEIDVYILER